MELLLPFFVLMASMAFILLGYLNSKRKLPLPPGPPAHPILGHMQIMEQLTHTGLTKLAAKYGGIMFFRLGFLPTLVISDAESAKQVLQVQDAVYSNRPATLTIRYLTYDQADMAFANYGPFWRQMRKLCVVKLFSRRRAESWQSVRDETDNLVTTLTAKSDTVVNIGELVFDLTRNITFKAAFGASFEDTGNVFISILQEFSKLFGAFNVGDYVPWLNFLDLQGLNKRLKKARNQLDHFIDQIIDDHMINKGKININGGGGGEDMVDELLVYLDDGSANSTNNHEGGQDDESTAPPSIKLTRDHIKAIIMDVMFGGTETVASAIEWAMAEMMHSPKEMQKVQDELKAKVGLDRKVRESDLEHLVQLKRVLKETLRMHPPIPLLLHETAEETNLCGYRVPTQCRVMINAYAIGRDASYWSEPNVFMPDRFATEGIADFKGSNFEFIPFGSGRRSCPGMQLGLYGFELAVAQMMHCFDWKLPVKPEDLDMSDVFGLTAPRATRLMATPTPRLSCLY